MREVTRSGKLNPEEPVVAYWIVLAGNGRREELNSIEKSRSYGFAIAKAASGDFFRMFLVSQKRREIRVSLAAGVPRAETRIDGHNAYLHRVYISTGKIDMFHVNYMELFGTDTSSGETCDERTNPCSTAAIVRAGESAVPLRESRRSYVQPPALPLRQLIPFEAATVGFLQPTHAFPVDLFRICVGVISFAYFVHTFLETSDFSSSRRSDRPCLHVASVLVHAAEPVSAWL